MTISTVFFTAIFNDAKPDLLFRPTVAAVTALEKDVISIVHVSGDSGNRISVLFCNLHRVKYITPDERYEGIFKE